MSLWGKNEAVAGTGTITVAVGNTTVVGTGTQFSTQLQGGDVIEYQGSDSVVAVVKSVSNNTHLTLKSAPVTGENATGVAFTISDKPKYLSETDAENNVEKITTADARDEAFYEIGIKTPGWVKSVTYVDAHGATRHKTETLVVFKS